MKPFLADETGQDLAEYSLLIAAIVVGCAAVIIGMGANVKVIWTTINSRLGAANEAP